MVWCGVAWRGVAWRGVAWCGVGRDHQVAKLGGDRQVAKLLSSTCTCTKRSLDTSATASTTASLAAPPGRHTLSFANRMGKLEAFLDSDDFPSRAGGGLEAVAQALHRRCARVVELHGGRLRT